MQTKLLKITMLLMIIPMNNWILFSQNSHPANNDSTIISRDAQRKCIKCLQNEPLKDSIIIKQKQRIELKDSTIQIQNDAINASHEAARELDGKLSDCKTSVVEMDRRRRNGIKWAAGIGGGAGAVLGWLLNGFINN